MAVHLELDVEAFNALAALANGPVSSLSPWSGVAVTDSGRTQLAGLGFLEPRGPRTDLQPTLNTIASATAATTVRYLGVDGLLDYTALVSADRGPVGLSVLARKGILRLEDPAPTARVIDFVAGLVGQSSLAGLDLNLDLSIEDSFVLAAIIDEQRRRILSGLATGNRPADAGVDVVQLRAALDTPSSIGFSFVGTIGRACGAEASRAVGHLTESLARMTRQGLLDSDPSAARLAGPAAALPARFVTITSIVQLANACDRGTDEVARLGFVCLQAGVTDLMTVEWVQSGIHLETVSADKVVVYIDGFLHQPDLARGSAAAAQATTPTTDAAANQKRPNRVGAPAAMPDDAGITAQPQGSTLAMTSPPTMRPPVWRPTHLVPVQGMPAWTTPDPACPPIARIDPRIELQLLERRGDWAHILCSNGWSAWVDGRAMEALPG